MLLLWFIEQKAYGLDIAARQNSIDLCGLQM